MDKDFLNSSDNPFIQQQGTTDQASLAAALQQLIQPPKQAKKKTINFDEEIMNVLGGHKLYRSSKGDLYSSCTLNDIEEILPVTEKEFASYIATLLYNKHHKIIQQKQIQSAIAIFVRNNYHKAEDKEEINRIASNDEALYLDRCTVPPSFIRVDHATGKKEIVSSSPFIPIRFRYQHSLPELKESDGHRLIGFLEQINVKDKSDILLTITFAVSKLFYKFYTPFLWIHGKKHSGKTTHARFIKNLIDPRQRLSKLPLKHEDVIQLYEHQCLVAIDNLGKIPNDLHDTFCEIYEGMELTHCCPAKG